MNSKSSVSNPTNQVSGMKDEEIRKKKQEIFDKIKKLMKPSRPDPFRPPIPHLKEPPKLQKPSNTSNPD
jgi:hypothetical protein